jgi:hypothetical protein
VLPRSAVIVAMLMMLSAQTPVGALGASPATLTASPNPAALGQAVNFVFAAGSSTCRTIDARAIYDVDFGDQTQLQTVQSEVPFAHAYARTGSFRAVIYLRYQNPGTPPPPSCAVAGAVVTVTGPAPQSAAHVLALSLTWPDGSSALTLNATEIVPNAVGLVRVDIPGTITIQWRLDGAPIQMQTNSSSAAGDIRFDLQYPLPNSGNHCLAMAVISPAQPIMGGALPAPPISYAYAGPSLDVVMPCSPGPL